MIRNIAAAALLIGVMAIPAQEARAQNNAIGGAIVGGVLGGVIGGAVTGRGEGAAVGAAIGAVSGAVIASEGERRSNGRYYYRSNCYAQDRYGNYYRVSRRYC